MFAYQVNDMTCGHCVRAITQAVLAADGDAKVDVDLARHLVQVESSKASDDTLRQAIEAAGYEPVAIESTSGRPEGQRTSGCCCGHGTARCGT